MSLPLAPRAGGSRTSRTIAWLSRPRSASRAASHSGRGTGWDDPPSSVRRSARSSGRCRRRPRMPCSTGCERVAWTTARYATWCRSSPTRRPPRATCPLTGPLWWSGSATSWATGGSSCTRLTACRCTRRGRWRSRRGFGSDSDTTVRRSRPMTESSCACLTRMRSRPAPNCSCSRRPNSSSSSPTRWAGLRCSPRASASARRVPCCCPAITRGDARRCGSSASAPRSCSRWPANIPASPSFWRPCARCCRMSTTSPR